jgi:hypothetical protein
MGAIAFLDRANCPKVFEMKKTKLKARSIEI